MKRKRKKAEILELFGDYCAESTDDGKFVVREKGILKSPHEYSAIEPLTAYCWALYRASDGRVDLLFTSGEWIMGVWEAYELVHFGGPNGPSIIVLHTDYGTTIIDDCDRTILSFEGVRNIGVLDDRFLVVYDPDPPCPYVRIYNFMGELISEGHLRDAEAAALKWKPPKRKTE